MVVWGVAGTVTKAVFYVAMATYSYLFDYRGGWVKSDNVTRQSGELCDLYVLVTVASVRNIMRVSFWLRYDIHP